MTGVPTAPVQATLAQYGMWITEQVGSTGTAYHLPVAVWLDGPLDRQAMLDACSAVIRRHSVLSCAFEERDGVLLLVPTTNAPPVTFTAVADVQSWIEQESKRPFDLRYGPLARFAVAEVARDRHVVLSVIHHLVFDGMSKDFLVQDLLAFYQGKPPAALEISHEQAADEQQARIADVLPAAAAYWQRRWQDADRPVTPGAGGVVDFDLTAEISDTAERIGVSRFDVLLALLHVVFGQPTVAVAMSTRRVETRAHLGLFATELPVIVTLGPDLSFRRFATQVKAEIRALNEFREVPLARAIGGMRPSAALAPVSISYRRHHQAPPLPGFDVKVDLMMSTLAIRNIVHLQADDGHDGLHARLFHNLGVVDRSTAENAAECFRSALKTVAADPDILLSELPTVALALPTEPTTGAAPVTGTALDPDLVAQIRLMWSEVLRIDEIGLDEDLYDLGGHSLTITQITARCRKRFGVEVPFDVFLDDPTVTGVATAISELRP
ncbi:acyl carrier protein [Kibdelosporangium banguiense]|uniref:Acyl carrier protein n=1 Tax=Kibdelosporangium banguiense TaxID=1365924 RepID=A0ABS4TN38_9PSEU|nr:condensation domain-containing protein [Kibdelosporangium banguiense]MBP2325819.1 acyl carrier protein [Kibdelosporangium banguiense]